MKKQDLAAVKAERELRLAEEPIFMGPKAHSWWDPPKHEGLVCAEPTLAQQHLKDECDVNNIVRRHTEQGVLTHVMAGMPQFGDFSEIQDYRSALDTVIRADEAFASLPAEVRREFDNDPEALLAALQDPSQRDRLEGLGLVEKRNSEAPAQSKSAPEGQSPSPASSEAKGSQNAASKAG